MATDTLGFGEGLGNLGKIFAGPTAQEAYLGAQVRQAQQAAAMKQAGINAAPEALRWALQSGLGADAPKVVGQARLLQIAQDNPNDLRAQDANQYAIHGDPEKTMTGFGAKLLNPVMSSGQSQYLRPETLKGIVSPEAMPALGQRPVTMGPLELKEDTNYLLPDGTKMKGPKSAEEPMSSDQVLADRVLHPEKYTSPQSDFLLQGLKGKANNTVVDLGNKGNEALDKAAIANIDQSKSQALGAVGTLQAISRQKQAIDNGMFTGFGADWKAKGASLAATLLGIDDKTLSNTEQFYAAANQKGAELAKQISNAGHTTNADLNIGKVIAGGDINKLESSLRGIIDAQEKLAHYHIDEHNKSVDEYKRVNPTTGDRADLFKVRKPEVYEYTHPAGPTPAGPVQVKSQAEYDALPKGAPYIAPDGSTRSKQ